VPPIRGLTARARYARLGRDRGGAARPPRRVAGATAAIAVVAFVLLGVRWHPPVYVVSPGPATDIAGDVTVTGVPVQPPSGRLLLVTVDAQQHSLFVDLAEGFRAHRELISTGSLGSFAYQRDLFQESQALAAAAAGGADGLPVTLTGQGALVTGVVAGSPAAGRLKAGDVIVAVDGTPVATEFDLARAVSARPAGTSFTLSVQRGGATVTLPVASSLLGGQAAIGVNLLTRDLAVAGPFRVTFRSRDIGGPSAGLVYALAVSSVLGDVNLHGSTVAATGTIDQSGTVGDVGGVGLKAIGARQQGARVFLTPAAEAGQARGLIPQVEGVTSLRQALQALGSTR
jgi:PDZ domain-containing protein